MAQPEAKLSQKIIKALEESFPCCAMDKVHGSVFSAVKLDLRGSVMGFAVEIEVKMPGEKPSPRQAQRIRFLKKMGVITGCCESVEEAVSIVREGLDRRRGRTITQEEIKQWAKD